MAKLLSLGLNVLADIFYPKYCFGCRRAGRYLCKFCITQIPGNAKAICIVCSQPSKDGFTHSSCKTEYTPDRLLCAFPYQNPIISDMIITGKYYFIPEVFAILGAMTADCLMQQYFDDVSEFVICAIPLHAQRLKWRGFNQSEIAARIVAQGFNTPYSNLLKRVKNTKTQKDLNAQARKLNMHRAFTCPKQVPAKIILVDDVATTGQTFLEAAAILKQSGAKTVWCLSIAKDWPNHVFSLK